VQLSGLVVLQGFIMQLLANGPDGDCKDGLTSHASLQMHG